MMRVVCIGVVVSSIGLSAAGQTTKPVVKVDVVAPQAAPSTSDAPAVPVAEVRAWPRAVEGLATALVRGDGAAVQGSLSSRALVRPFDGSSGVEVSRLLERVSKSTLIGQHGYLHPPLVMAADISADFKNAAVVPEKAKAKYVADDDAEIKRANATAVQWVVEQLNARTGMPVGVIVLWTPRAAVAGATADAAVIYDAVFVLCRGEEVAPQEFKIDTVVFGAPMAE